MAGYSTLVAGKATLGSIANWVNRSDLPVAEILTEAQALIYETLRVREMIVFDDITAVSGQTGVALPSDFLDIVKFTPYGWTDPMFHEQHERFVQQKDSDGNTQEGTPSCYTIMGTAMHFDTELTENMAGMIVYYGRPTAMSASNETPFLTVRYPTLLRHACMSFAFEHMKKPNDALYYRKLVVQEAAEASDSNDLYRRGAF